MLDFSFFLFSFFYFWLGKRCCLLACSERQSENGKWKNVVAIFHANFYFFFFSPKRGWGDDCFEEKRFNWEFVWFFLFWLREIELFLNFGIFKFIFWKTVWKKSKLLYGSKSLFCFFQFNFSISPQLVSPFPTQWQKNDKKKDFLCVVWGANFQHP